MLTLDDPGRRRSGWRHQGPDLHRCPSSADEHQQPSTGVAAALHRMSPLCLEASHARASWGIPHGAHVTATTMSTRTVHAV